MNSFLTIAFGLIFTLSSYGQDKNISRAISINDSILLRNFWIDFKNAITNKDPNRPGVYYYEAADYDSQTVLHEALHFLTGLNDVDLAAILGLMDSNKQKYTDRLEASAAIKNSLYKECQK